MFVRANRHVITPEGAPAVAAESNDSFGSRAQLEVGGTSYEYFRLDAVDGSARLPFSLKVLLENLLRTEDGKNVTSEQIQALADWQPDAEPDTEIQFTPARVVMQDFTGVPAVVDLATMREAVVELGGDATKINPLAPAELVIDHSVIADFFGADFFSFIVTTLASEPLPAGATFATLPTSTPAIRTGDPWCRLCALLKVALSS